MKNIKVVHVLNDDYKVVLNVGRNDGIRNNQRFLVYALSDHEIIDPDTKKSLGFLEIVKGSGKVVHVQDNMCTIESDKYKSTPVRKKIRNAGVLSSLYEPVEEIVTTNEHFPFDDPEIGDLAKPI